MSRWFLVYMLLLILPLQMWTWKIPDLMGPFKRTVANLIPSPPSTKENVGETAITKEILFFPMFGFPTPIPLSDPVNSNNNSKNSWTFYLKGITYSNNPSYLSRFLKWTAGQFGCTNDEKPTLYERMSMFGIRFEQIRPQTLQICSENTLPTETPSRCLSPEENLARNIALNGLFELQQVIYKDQFQNESTFSVQMPQDDSYTLVNQGLLTLVDNAGFSIISDIDDTIKETGILDKYHLFNKVMCAEYLPVKKMPQVFAKWSQILKLNSTFSQPTFHYVSASPWQLFPPLQKFLQKHAFPLTSIHLRNLSQVSIKDIIKVVMDSYKFKMEEISRIIQQLPQRRFVLIGDATEKDPEVYGDIARQFPNAIHCIFIRNIPAAFRDNRNETKENEIKRFKAAFSGIPSSKIALFDDGDELDRINLELSCQP